MSRQHGSRRDTYPHRAPRAWARSSSPTRSSGPRECGLTLSPTAFPFQQAKRPAASRSTATCAAARPGRVAVGDIERHTGADEHALLPQVAPVAIQSGYHVAGGRSPSGSKVLRPARSASRIRPGTMATIRQRSAVADLPLGIRVHGHARVARLARVAPCVPDRVPRIAFWCFRSGPGMHQMGLGTAAGARSGSSRIQRTRRNWRDPITRAAWLRTESLRCWLWVS